MRPAAGDAFKFNGKFYEAATGLYDYAARWYDPVSQRFLSQDPIGWASGQSNLYVYVGNSPLNYTDPSGMMTVEYASLSRAGTTVAGGVVGGLLGFLCGYLDAKYSDDPNVRNDAWWYGLEGGVAGAAIGASLAYLGGPGATAAAGAVATGAGLGLAGIFAVSLYVDPGNGKQIAVKVGCIVAGVVAGGIGRWGIRRAGGRGVPSDPIIVAGPGAQQPPIIVTGPGAQGPPIIVSQLPAGPRIPRVGSPGTAPTGPRPSHPVPRPPATAAESPGPGWEWRGQQPVGGERGAWFRPATGETLHPDLGHPAPVGPHWDWRAPDGTFWRLFPDGRVEPRP